MFVDCNKFKEIDLSKLKISKDEINTNKIFEDLKDVSVKVRKDIIDKFKNIFKDINFIAI